MNLATKYFYCKNQQGSVTELVDNASTLQAQYTYDLYGRVAKLSEAIPADFNYTGMYFHTRSGLNLTLFRAYSPVRGRWLSREPRAEKFGGSRFEYASNDPANLQDYFGDEPFHNVIFPPGSTIQSNAPSDVISVGGHGEPGGHYSLTGNPIEIGPLMSVDALAAALKPFMHPGKPCVIELCVCHAGSPGKGPSLASLLARATGCWVVGCKGYRDSMSGEVHGHQDWGPWPDAVDPSKGEQPQFLFSPDGSQYPWATIGSPTTDADWQTVQNITGGSLFN